MSVGLAPNFAFRIASSARLSISIRSMRVFELWAHPDEFVAMMTIDASAIEVCDSANTPREFATPSRADMVRIEPAALKPAAAAFRQTMPARAALWSGGQFAVPESKDDFPVIGFAEGSPLNSGFSGASFASS